MTIIDGEIQIPADIEKYIKRPISAVEIVPEVWEKFKNDNIVKENRFQKDILKVNRIYNLKGEILEIRNNIPVIKVIINNRIYH